MAWNWRSWLKPSRRPTGGAGCSTAVALVLATSFVVLGYVFQNDIRIPPNFLPWEPIDLNAPPGWIAHQQLNQLHENAQLCNRALAATPMLLSPMKDRATEDACGFQDVVRADRTPISMVPRTTATCGLTAALFWYQKALQSAARARLHTGITRIDQLGTFACRNVDSEATGPRSEHATANAIDIAQFHFADGRTAIVARDYGKPTPEGRFLDTAHDAACSLFNTVLGPRYNRLHANHFHLDMGRYTICR
jgi:hypothetical protein